jgi:hypothetical protein
MLYGALRQLTAVRLVDETEAPSGFESGGGRPRFYRLTPAGRRACAAEARRLAQLVDVARGKGMLKKPRPG